jgi:DNA ligase D-like protein (predicted 3'-phosphoesterase)
MINDPLKKYNEKRNFSKTQEPKGKIIRSKNEPIFIIQKHAARNLHYDFRLETNGYLKSWAIPKGPSMDPKVKRLAIPTEDHPLSYANFEGVIPEGEYGAGAVIVWDQGVYEIMKDDPKPLEKYLENGHVTLSLLGKKLKGGFALIQTGNARAQSNQRWLFFKMKDDDAMSGSDILIDEPNSVISGKSLDEILKGIK